MDTELIHDEAFCFSAEIFTEVLQQFCSNMVGARCNAVLTHAAI